MDGSAGLITEATRSQLGGAGRGPPCCGPGAAAPGGSSFRLDDSWHSSLYNLYLQEQGADRKSKPKTAPCSHS